MNIKTQLKRFLNKLKFWNKKQTPVKTIPIQGTSVEELLSRDKKIRSCYKSETEENKIVTCPSCRASVKESEIIKCDQCGRTGCVYCFFTSKKGYSCDNCW